MAGVFVHKSQLLVDVFYFSAYAHWLPDAKKRHQQYVKALAACGVTPVMGKFKEKDRKCDCGRRWTSHEEKETDVNIALAMLNLAYQNKYDRALLISNDSDLAPAIRMVRENFPSKSVVTIMPPRYYHSLDLINASSEKTKIVTAHLERCLLPEVIHDVGGNIVAIRCIPKKPQKLGNAGILATVFLGQET